MKKGVGNASGKLILMGEHSVVYGKLSVGIPFLAVNMQLSVEETDGPAYVDSSLYQGELEKIPNYLENLYAVYNSLKRDLGLETKNFYIDIDSTIPIERGLGSSASLGVALVRAFEDYVSKKFSQEKFLEYVDQAEKISHGNPSGLDARLVTLQAPLLYQKNKSITNFYFDTDYYLVVVDSGITGQTKQAVSDVRANYDSPYYARSSATKKAINYLDDLSHAYVDVLKNDSNNLERLAYIINEAHDALRTLQTSSPELDEGIKFSLEHGAKAGKLTGGGRGGCYYLLTETKAEATKLKNLILANDLGVEAWTIPLSSINMSK